MGFAYDTVDSQSKAQDLPVIIVDDSPVQSDTVGNSENSKDENSRPSETASERTRESERGVNNSTAAPQKGTS